MGGREWMTATCYDEGEHNGLTISSLYQNTYFLERLIELLFMLKNLLLTLTGNLLLTLI